MKEGLTPDVHPEGEPDGPPADSGDPRGLPEMEGINTKLAHRIIGHLIADPEDAKVSRENLYNQSTRVLLRYIAQLIDVGPIEQNRTEKRKLFDAILEKVIISFYL